jgi:hypothetical protein
MDRTRMRPTSFLSADRLLFQKVQYQFRDLYAVQTLSLIRIGVGREVTKYTPVQSLTVLKSVETEFHALYAIGTHIELRMRTKSNANFDFLLSTFSHTESQDPRDVFYAIRSIANIFERVPKPHSTRALTESFETTFSTSSIWGLVHLLYNEAGR